MRSSNETLIAVALSAAVGVTTIRVFITAIYALREEAGVPTAAVVALVTFAAPALAGGLRRAAGPRTIAGVAIAQAIALLALQQIHPIQWQLAAVATMLGLIAWTLLLHEVRSAAAADGTAFAVAFLVGSTLDAFMHAAFRTWDAPWHTDTMATVSSIVLAAGLAVAAVRASGSLAAPVEGLFRASLPLAALGIYLVLGVLFFQNVAFANSETGFGLLGGTMLVLIGDLIAIAGLVRLPVTIGRGRRLLDVIMLVGAAWLMTDHAGMVGVSTSMVVGSFAAARLLGAALSVGRADARSTIWRTSLTVAIGCVAFVLCVLLYQLHITNPLPVSNRWIPVAAALLLGAAGMTRHAVSQRVPRRVLVVPAAFALIAPVLILHGAPSPAVATPASVRLLDWNVHSAVDEQGMLDPVAIADEIRRQGADVVVLQEVPRGWVIAGTLDLATWLADDLGMSMAWAPAADGQFGNVILSTIPIRDSQVIALPYGAGPQHRSALRTDLALPGGGTLTVVGTHLEHEAGTSTSADQIRTITEHLGSISPVVIAGDMNLQPLDPDLALFEDAGFVSGQDVTGHGGESTSREPAFPGDRVDWLFGRGVTFSDFQIASVRASDHLPLVVTVST